MERPRPFRSSMIPMRRTAPARRVATALAALALAFAAGCAPRGDDGVARALHGALAHVKHDAGTLEGRVARFYGARGDRPAWLDGRRPSADVRALRTALASLPGDGVYGWEADVAAIDSALAVRNGFFGRASASDTALARFDLALTTAWLAAASRLHDGAIPAERLDKAWRAKTEKLTWDKRLAKAIERHAVRESLAACAPRDSEYVRLRAALAREVLAFQRAHGRDTTGVADDSTRAAMGEEERARVDAAAMNLERHRWLGVPRRLPRVEVNVADMTLWAKADTGAALRMRVIVGDRKHPTPIFSSAIAWIDLHPTWTLSPRVVAEEIVPSLRRNPHWLEEHGMIALRPVQGKLVEVPLADVVLDSVASDTFRTFIRQPAGDGNPLGHLRFMLPNAYAVYLHDTNQRGLFKLEDRARSHGCVRLQRPQEFAAWLLSLAKPTPPDSVRAAVRDTTARRWDLKKRVPIDVLYWTAWADDEGRLQVRKDLYGLDRRMLAAIRRDRAGAFELNPAIDWAVAP